MSDEYTKPAKMPDGTIVQVYNPNGHSSGDEKLKGRSARLKAVRACKDRKEIAKLIEAQTGIYYVEALDWVDGVYNYHTPAPQGDALALITQGKEAANYLFRELNFADMDTAEGATPGVQQAHAELLDALDKLGRAARATPQPEDRRAALAEEQEAFRQYLCDCPELEDDPIMDYWHDLSMAINAVLQQPSVDVGTLRKQLREKINGNPFLYQDESDPIIDTLLGHIASKGYLRTPPEKVEGLGETGGFELDHHVKMWCNRLLNSINAALSDADVDDIEEHMRQCVEDWIGKFSQYDVLENALDGWTIKIKPTGYEICDEKGDSMVEHSSFEVAMTKAIDLHRTTSHS